MGTTLTPFVTERTPRRRRSIVRVCGPGRLSRPGRIPRPRRLARLVRGHGFPRRDRRTRQYWRVLIRRRRPAIRAGGRSLAARPMVISRVRGGRIVRIGRRRGIGRRAARPEVRARGPGIRRTRARRPGPRRTSRGRAVAAGPAVPAGLRVPRLTRNTARTTRPRRPLDARSDRRGRRRPDRNHRPRRRRRQERHVHRAGRSAVEFVGAGRDRRQGGQRGQADQQGHDQHVPAGGTGEAVGSVHAVEALAQDLERRHQTVVLLLRHDRHPSPNAKIHMDPLRTQG
jgi:hypothetical protein